MKYRHLFGPVPSRRLGISLGIDLIPAKICSQNCIYCEVGETTELTLTRKEYISLESVCRELDNYLGTSPELDFITFSGSGEPTLNSRTGELVLYLKENYPQYKLACITNSSLLWDAKVREELVLVDLLLPSLDAVSEAVFQKLNRPHIELMASMIVEGLIEFRKIYGGEIWLEIFLSPGINDTQSELAKLKQACAEINAEKIQLNTIDRPGVERGLRAETRERLEEIVEYFQPLPVEIIADARVRKQRKSYSSEISSQLLELISRRPCTDQDLCQILGLHINELNKYVSSLLASGQIREVEGERGIFFEIRSH